MKDELAHQYNRIVVFNFIFIMLLISFMIYFNPFGYFSANSTSVGDVNSTRMNVAVGLAVIVVVGNIVMIARYYKKMGKKRK